MEPVISFPAVPLMPDQSGGDAVSFFFDRFATRTFINSSDDPPHRHTYQELLLIEEGLLRHGLDGQHYEVGPHTLALIPRGRVHTVDRAIEVVGWIIQFTDDFLPADRAGGAWPEPAPLSGLGLTSSLALRPDDLRGLNAVAALIEAEWADPARPDRDDALRHLLATLLIRIGRIHEAATGTDLLAREEQRVYRDFTALLERDFAAHHDVGHYAAALGLDPDRLSAMLARLLGRPTKRVIDERLVLEAKRALRFTDRPLGAIAADLGYSDQFHLSKTFKRLTGVSPQTFRRQPEK
jgi:AraC-like DNA-binding protein/mannose-6-phosphate isomerase-like protein (cupin superfamily)